MDEKSALNALRIMSHGLIGFLGMLLKIGFQTQIVFTTIFRDGLNNC
jgi:hypothetical protein